MNGSSAPEPDPVRIPITGELDLHAFQPGEVPALLEDYFQECRKRRLLVVRVIHGKGTGALRDLVRASVHRSPQVAGHRNANETEGSWGATIVELRPPAG